MQSKKGRHRIKAEDIFTSDANIRQQNVDRNFGQSPPKTIIVYTIFGKHDHLDDNGNPILNNEESDMGFAKEVVTQTDRKFFVKQGDNGRLYNPIGTLDEGTHSKHRHHTDIKRWRYRQVNWKIFTLYLAFLRTKNTAYHKNAEREII